MGEGPRGGKIVENCVTSFMDDPFMKFIEQVLHLLHQKPGNLKELDLASYKSPHYRYIESRLM